MSIYRSFIKRIIGFTMAALGLLVLGIPMLIIAVLIKGDSKGPALFKQERLGKDQKPFTIYKFRTMVVNAFEIGGIANRSDDPRITKVGAFLRRTSLDELPQMLNILNGTMAIIGPRPILEIEFEEYKNNPLYVKRYEVLPGMFCTIDVDYRASSTRVQQFEMDAQYVDEMCFITDLKCFCQIISVVIGGKNVYREEVERKKE